MPAGKSPNNAFNLHKERMKPIFKILDATYGDILIKYKDVIKPLSNPANVPRLATGHECFPLPVPDNYWMCLLVETASYSSTSVGWGQGVRKMAEI